jgi:hypothetical protein
MSQASTTSRPCKTIHGVAPVLLNPQMGRKTWGPFREAGGEGADGTGEPEEHEVLLESPIRSKKTQAD